MRVSRRLPVLFVCVLLAAAPASVDEESPRDVLRVVLDLPLIHAEQGPLLDLKGEKPFAPDKLKYYHDDGKPGALRKLLTESADVLKENVKPPLLFRFRAGPANPNAEAQYRHQLVLIQKQIALAEFELDKQAKALAKRSAERDKETLHVRAVHDFTLARLLGRMIHLREYNLQLGKMVKEFPERDPAMHPGWELVGRLEVQIEGDPEVEALVRERKKVLDRIVLEHSETPLAVLARREKDLPLGLTWRPWPR